MNRVNWTAVIIFSVVVLLVFLAGVSVLGGWGYRGGGMMGPGGMMVSMAFGSSARRRPEPSSSAGAAVGGLGLKPQPTGVATQARAIEGRNFRGCD